MVGEVSLVVRCLVEQSPGSLTGGSGLFLCPERDHDPSTPHGPIPDTTRIPVLVSLSLPSLFSSDPGPVCYWGAELWVTVMVILGLPTVSCSWVLPSGTPDKGLTHRYGVRCHDYPPGSSTETSGRGLW